LEATGTAGTTLEAAGTAGTTLEAAGTALEAAGTTLDIRAVAAASFTPPAATPRLGYGTGGHGQQRYENQKDMSCFHPDNPSPTLARYDLIITSTTDRRLRAHLSLNPRTPSEVLQGFTQKAR
jgi:hypothetical protein